MSTATGSILSTIVEQQEELVAALQSQALKFVHDPNMAREMALATSVAIDKLVTLRGLVP